MGRNTCCPPVQIKVTSAIRCNKTNEVWWLTGFGVVCDVKFGLIKSTSFGGGSEVTVWCGGSLTNRMDFSNLGQVWSLTQYSPVRPFTTQGVLGASEVTGIIETPSLSL